MIIAILAKILNQINKITANKKFNPILINLVVILFIEIMLQREKIDDENLKGKGAFERIEKKKIVSPPRTPTGLFPTKL